MQACIQCGVSEPPLLRTVKLHLIENNHLLGRNNDPERTVPMCLNCHALYTAQQRLSDVWLDAYPERNVLDWIADCAIQIAYVLRVIAESIEVWVVQLRERAIPALDEEFPLWRDLPQVSIRPGDKNARTGR